MNLKWRVTRQDLRNKTQWSLFYDRKLSAFFAKKSWIAGADFKKMRNDKGEIKGYMLVVTK